LIGQVDRSYHGSIADHTFVTKLHAFAITKCTTMNLPNIISVRFAVVWAESLHFAPHLGLKQLRCRCPLNIENEHHAHRLSWHLDLHGVDRGSLSLRASGSFDCYCCHDLSIKPPSIFSMCDSFHSRIIPQHQSTSCHLKLPETMVLLSCQVQTLTASH
jgi:hypothetical protein